jgi:hypothetical protein
MESSLSTLIAGSCEVDDEFKPSRAAHRQVGRFFSLEDTAGIVAGLTTLLNWWRPITSNGAGDPQYRPLPYLGRGAGIASPPRIWSAIRGKRIEADVVARPAGTLKARTFLAAPRAACAGTQFVAGSIRPPQDYGDCARQRCVMLAPLTPQSYPGRRPL